jgi:predicted transcriptional regulator
MIEEILESHGYKLLKAEYSKSFEIIAKLKKEYFIFKRYRNIDLIPKEIASDLKNLESFLGAKSFVIGEKTCRNELKDCIYLRRGIKVISSKYFEDFLSGKIKKIYSFGKEVVKVDFEKLRKIREEKGMSLRTLSNLVGISKKSLIRIEKGIEKPTYETYKKLKAVLNTELSVEILNLEKSNKKVYHFYKTSFYKGILEKENKIIFPKENAIEEAKKISKFLKIKMKN